MTKVFVDTTKIADWPSFHRVFSQIFGFPAFYGNNMAALVDCLSYLDEPEAAMTSLHVKPGETLAIQLGAVVSFRRRCPELFEALQDACAFGTCRRSPVAPVLPPLRWPPRRSGAVPAP
ncbi:barstar family protein, partial [Burkholderia ubonensis]|uniref:barstar family protein n=1 Tax=Burkholderia ubonensis TaxID=101571 RepID=UPI0012FADEAC